MAEARLRRDEVDQVEAAADVAVWRPPAITWRWPAPRPLTKHGALLGLVVALATALRVVDLARTGLNSDEAVYASQSASLAGNEHFTGLFPVVRAHPLLLQVLMSPLFRHGVPDTVGRFVAAGFGVGTVVLVYVLGRVLYGGPVGLLAAALLAVMPYHVVISRQILLDGPLAFFTTAALICLAVAVRSSQHRWTVGAGACLGLAALSKETAVILVGSALVFHALLRTPRRPVRLVVAGTALALGLAACYPALTALSGGSRSGQSYLLWQLTRRPNHSFAFYLLTVGGSMGFVLLASSALALLLTSRTRQRLSWREMLLLSWAAVPVLFFEVWPVKGFSYLMPVAPVAVVLAASGLWRLREVLPHRWQTLGAGLTMATCFVTLLVPAAAQVARPSTSGMAGAGGLPAGREVGRWVGAHVPEGAQLMTIGPSMANVIQYYSGHRCDGLSVSPNPLHRNPTYRPIVNAHAALRSGRYQYVVWDAYSARRSSHFAAEATALVQRFHGQAVHTERGRFGGRPHQPLVVVYEVRP